MAEATRRRMLWIIIALASAFFLLTLYLAATNTLNASWYLLGAGVYAGLFLIAVFGFATEKDLPPAAAAPPAAQPAPMVMAMPMPVTWMPAQQVPTPEAVRIARTERVVYSTPRGQVLEVREGTNGTSRRTYIVEGDEEPLTSDDIGRIVDRSEGSPGKRPEEPELRAALQRWGRIREEVP